MCASKRAASPARKGRDRMDRYWLLPWTTYGTWLPGDERNYVDQEHNIVGTAYAPPAPLLQEIAKKKLRHAPTWLSKSQAEVLLSQFHATAKHRGWQLLAVAVMGNHIHIVLGVPGDPEPDTLLRDLKAYGSRALNATSVTGSSRRVWWTQSGSRRKLPNENAVLAAVRYVERQHRALVVWVAAGIF